MRSNSTSHTLRSACRPGALLRMRASAGARRAPMAGLKALYVYLMSLCLCDDGSASSPEAVHCQREIIIISLCSSLCGLVCLLLWEGASNVFLLIGSVDRVEAIEASD